MATTSNCALLAKSGWVRSGWHVPCAMYFVVMALSLTLGCRDERLIFYRGLSVEELFSNHRVRQLVHRAVEGNVEEVRALVQAGVDVNALGRGKVTPLIAVLFQGGSKEGVRALLDLGADPNRVMVNGNSALNVIASFGDAELAKMVLQYGGKVDLLNEGHPFWANNRTPLIYAVEDFNSEVAKIFVEHGADINHADESRLTPLRVALRTRNYELAYFFIERGARLNDDILKFIRERIEDFYREGRICDPGETKWFDKIVALLESQGYDMRPPAMARQFRDPRVNQLVLAAIEGDLEEIRALVDAGVDLNAKGELQMITPLIAMLMQWGSKEGFQALLEHGADPNARMTFGLSVMHICAMRSDPWWIETAIRHGGQVDLFNEGDTLGIKNSTPLMYAARAGYTEVAKVLVDHGADVNLADGLGTTPLASALANRDYELAYYLLERGARLDATAVREETRSLQFHLDNKSPANRYRRAAARMDDEGDLLQFIINRNNPVDRQRRATTPGETEWFDKILALLESRGIATAPPDHSSQ